MPEIEYPGVHVEETSFRARSIEGVPTSGTAFVTATGELERHDRVVSVSDYPDFAVTFPGSVREPVGVSVRLFFENGGSDLSVLLASPDEPLAPQLSALDDVSGLSLLCLPGETDAERLKAALAYAQEHRLFLLVDPPGRDADGAVALAKTLAETGSANAAVYFPSPVIDSAPVPASGAVAGLFGRTDRTRGVWKPAAGVEATLLGVDGPAAALTDPQDEQLSSAGVNAIRMFPDRRIVVWGARTIQGSDAAASEWKSVPVRRLILYLEESIDRGTRWAVFEPNDDSLWAAVRQQVADFLHGLWKAGAFVGSKPEDAFFVRCDQTTMTQDDLDNGRLVILVGVAPIKPAEFVIVRIEKAMTQPPPPEQEPEPEPRGGLLVGFGRWIRRWLGLD